MDQGLSVEILKRTLYGGIRKTCSEILKADIRGIEMEESYYLELLREKGYTHEQVLEELDDLVQSGQMSSDLHSILMSALEVACE